MLKRIVIRGLSVIGLWCFYNAGYTYAQDKSVVQPTDTIPSETLTGVYVISGSKPSATAQTVPIQVLDRTQIEKLGVQELFEAVRTFSGISIKDYGGIGGLKTVSIRSMGSEHTAVCYDGMTISNAQNGQIDIGRFSLDNIEQISLSIGQSDDIFQTARMFASAGALNIKSAKPRFDKSHVNLTAQMKFASFGLYNPYLLYEQRLGERWALIFNGDWLTADGEYPFILKNGNVVTHESRKNSDVNTIRGELNLYGVLKRGGRLSVKGSYLNSERGLPGSVVLYNNDATERLWDKNSFATLHYEKDFSDKWSITGNLKYNYAWNRYLIKSEIYKDGKQEDFYTQNEYYGSISTKYSPTSKIRFTFAEDLFVNTLFSSIPESTSPLRYTSLSAFAGQFKTERVTVTASLLGMYITERVGFGDAAPDRKRLSPAVSLSYKIFKNRNLRFRASFKDAFRVPTFNDLYYVRVGNINLKPERASQYNFGVAWNGKLPRAFIDYASISLDGYYNSVKNKIVAIPTMFVWKMMNIGRVEITGLDANISANIALPARMSLYVSGAYSYQRALNVTDPEAKNYRHQIPYTPRHSGNATLSFMNEWVNVSYIMTLVGERYALPQNIEANKIEGYSDHSISMNRTFDLGRCRLKVQAECVNIGNTNYEVIQYYPMPGRSYRLTIKLIY